MYFKCRHSMPSPDRCASPIMTLEVVKIELKEFLNTQSQTLIDEIKSLLQNLDFNYNEKYNKDNIAALQFEYEVLGFDIIVYPIDKFSHVAGDIKLLLTDKQNDNFFPDNIEYDLLNKVDADEYEQLEKEIIEYKYSTFESWFCDCWDKAKGNTKLHGFFSIHDTIWVTNLADRKKIREDTIPEILKF